MLLRMLTMLSVRVSCGVCACDRRQGRCDMSHLLKNFRIAADGQVPVLCSVHIVTWRRFFSQRQQLVHQRGQFSGNHTGLSVRSFSQHAFNKFRGGLDIPCVTGVTNTYISKEAPSSESFSAKKSSAIVNNERLVKAIVYEAQRDFINVVGKNKRFCDFLLEQVTALAESVPLGFHFENQEVFQSLSLDTKLYDQMEIKQRIELLNQIAHGLGFDGLQDLIDYDTATKEASQGLQESTHANDAVRSKYGSLDSKLETEEVPEKEIQKRGTLRMVPGIIYGSSQPIKLWDGVGSTSRLILQKSAKSEVSKSPEAVQLEGHEVAPTSTSQPEDLGSLDAVQSKGHKVAPVLKTKSSDGLGSTSHFISPQPAQPEVLGTVAAAQSEGLKGAAVLKTRKSTLKSVEETKKTVRRSAEETKKAVGQSAVDADIVHIVDPLTHTTKIKASKTFAIDEKWGLDMPMSSVKCLSSTQRTRLEENGFNTLRLLLQHFPRMYQNFQQAGQSVEDGQNLSFVGVIVQSRGSPRGATLGLLEVVVRSEVDEVRSDGTSENMVGAGAERGGQMVYLHLKKFFKGTRYSSTWFLNTMANKYPVNAQVTVCGKVKEMALANHFEIREFNIELWDGSDRQHLGSDNPLDMTSTAKPYPVYPGKGSLQPRTIEFCIQRILPLLSVQLDPIPKDLRDKFELQELHEAYNGIHSPAIVQDAGNARQRLVFDEFFYLQLGMLLSRQELAEKFGVVPELADLATQFKGGILDMEKWSPLTLMLVNSLPYTLTKSQIKAAGEVLWDLQRPVPMSRLLQGDVGCGKTIVAVLAILEVAHAGYQGALMAPTEFLATQHYQRITSWLENLEEGERPCVALLTGSTPAAKARVIRNGFESGEIRIAIGTHSLISDSVKFSSLRLAVIDEQHRFGVSQRGRLNSKTLGLEINMESTEGNISKSVPAGALHILAMSATPIPRTLALALHGDMSLSQITELPPGRPEIATYAIYGDKKGRQEAFKRVRKELDGGGRVFVVFPAIEESEQVPDIRAAETEFSNLAVEFKDYEVGLVHGRMRTPEKEEAMQRFKSGETQVLVSTTVIEVGIDIPEASMIVVEHAERYGMAQLHQLRGRVGRGTRDSSCILLASRSSALARLKLLEESRDGFYLAEVDLKHRGPGDMLGKRQSGYLPEFTIAQLEKDGDILDKARSAAEEVLQIHPKLEGLPKIRHELSMRRPPSSLS